MSRDDAHDLAVAFSSNEFAFESAVLEPPPAKLADGHAPAACHAAVTQRAPVSPAVGMTPVPPALSERSAPRFEHLAPRLRFATQPIIDRTGRVVATELLFRWNTADAPVGPELGGYATAAALSHALIDGDLLCPDHLAEHPIGDLLVNMDRRSLLSPMADVLTPDLGVLELLETVEVDATLVERVAELHDRGYRFALDDVVSLDDPRWTLAPWSQFVKIDVQVAPSLIVPALVRKAHRVGMAVIAEKVEDEQDLAWLKALGVDYFQGYGIARPHAHAVQPLPGCDSAALSQAYLLASDGRSDEAVAAAVSQHPAIVARLLRLQALHAPSGVAVARSLVDVIRAVPRRVLVGWLVVLNIAAAHQRDQAVVRAWRAELDDHRRRLRRQGRVTSSAELEAAAFAYCQRVVEGAGPQAWARSALRH